MFDLGFRPEGQGDPDLGELGVADQHPDNLHQNEDGSEQSHEDEHPVVHSVQEDLHDCGDEADRNHEDHGFDFTG